MKALSALTTLPYHGRVLPQSSASASPSASTYLASDHAKFVKNVAALDPPEHLLSLINILRAKGEEIVEPDDRRGIIPLAIPLSRDPSSGLLTALLRWPTPPEGMEMPVVQVHTFGVCLLGKTVNQYIQRILVEEDAMENGPNHICYTASGDAGKHLYNKGDFKDSKLPSLDVYLLKKVGHFPDVFERLALRHVGKGDQVSALVTGEYYASKKHFPGFGRPFIFNAELMLQIGRVAESKDAARIAFKSPWWTFGCSYEKAAELAGWEDEKVEYMRERVTEEGKREEIKKGKSLEQVSLDQAAFLLDLASVDKNWDAIREQLATCYKEAGLLQISNFIGS